MLEHWGPVGLTLNGADRANENFGGTRPLRRDFSLGHTFGGLQLVHGVQKWFWCIRLCFASLLHWLTEWLIVWLNDWLRGDVAFVLCCYSIAAVGRCCLLSICPSISKVVAAAAWRGWNILFYIYYICLFYVWYHVTICYCISMAVYDFLLYSAFRPLHRHVHLHMYSTW